MSGQWLGAYFGRVYHEGQEVELAGGLNFRGAITVSRNDDFGYIEIIVGAETELGTSGGDVIGTLASPVVVGLQGYGIGDDAPQDGDVLTFEDGFWKPAAGGGGGGDPAVGNNLSGTASTAVVIGIRNVLVHSDASAPSDGHTFRYSNALSAWIPSLVNSDMLDANAVETAAINDQAVTTDKLAGIEFVSVSSSRALALTDRGRMLLCDDGSDPVAIEIPLNATAAFPVGSQVALKASGTGALTVDVEGGVTLHVPASRAAEAFEQYSVIVLTKEATNTWTLSGDLAEAP